MERSPNVLRAAYAGSEDHCKLLTKKSGAFQEEKKFSKGHIQRMTISYEQIAKRAFEIWKEEGEIEGKEQEHWLRAETELRERQTKSQKGKKVLSKDPSMLKTPRGENL